MFYFGAIAAAFVSAALIGRYGIERVLALMLLFGGLCILVTGFATLSVMALSVFILGFGFGTGGTQLGICALPGAIYPTAIRSTGAGFASGVGRLGNVAGALLGGALLGLGWSPQQMLLALCAAPLVNAVLMWVLRRLRRAPAARPALYF
jgi:AAHS family 4-hydroxybenzoate transporter-like MFS transporter